MVSLQGLAAEVAHYLGMELGKIKIKRFADGEIYCQIGVSEWAGGVQSLSMVVHCMLDLFPCTIPCVVGSKWHYTAASQQPMFSHCDLWALRCVVFV